MPLADEIRLLWKAPENEWEGVASRLLERSSPELATLAGALADAVGRGEYDGRRWSAVAYDLLLRKRHRQAALKIFDTLVEKEPDNPAYLNNRGVALLELARPEEAIVDFGKAFAKDLERGIDEAMTLPAWKNLQIAVSSSSPRMTAEPSRAIMREKGGLELPRIRRIIVEEVLAGGVVGGALFALIVGVGNLFPNIPFAGVSVPLAVIILAVVVILMLPKFKKKNPQEAKMDGDSGKRGKWRGRWTFFNEVVVLIVGLIVISGWWLATFPPPPPPKPELELTPLSATLLKKDERVIIPQLNAKVRNNGTVTALGVSCEASVYQRDFFDREEKVDFVQQQVGLLKPKAIAPLNFDLNGTAINQTVTPPQGYNVTIECETQTGERTNRSGIIIHEYDPKTGTGNVSFIFEHRTDRPLYLITQRGQWRQTP